MKRTRHIAINLDTSLSGDLYVERVAVWNSDTKPVDDIVVDWSGDLGWQILDSVSDMTVTSLSVSLRTQTGESGGMLKFYSVCAETKLLNENRSAKHGMAGNGGFLSHA